MGSPSTLRINILADASRANAGFNQLEQRAGKLSGKMKVAFAAAGVAVAAFAKDAIKAASELQQNLGGAQAVFGKYSDTVIKNSKAAANAFGLSQSDYLESANKLGALLHGQGLAADKLAGSTQSLIQKGSDLAATFGGTTADAVDALTSALKGETDPIERYGISLKQSDINAQLAAKGQTKLTGTAKKLATQQAALTLINKQSTAANGQFSKQTGTLAEQQQILSAKFENVEAKVGTALLPILSKLFDMFLKNILPAVQAVAHWFDQNASAVRTLAIVFAPLLVALGAYVAITKIAAIVQAALNVVLLANPIILIVTALIALGVALVIAYKKCETFRNIVDKAFAVVKTVVRVAISYVATQIGIAQAIFTAIARTARTAFSAVSTAIGSVGRALSAAYSTVTRIGGNIVGFIRGIPGKVSNIAGSMLKAGGHIISSLFSGIRSALGSAGGFIGDIGRDIVNAIIRGLNAVLPHRIHIHIPIPAAPDVNINIPLIPNIPLLGSLQPDSLHGAFGGSNGGPITVNAQPNVAVFIDGQEIKSYAVATVDKAMRRVGNRTASGVR